MELEVLLQTAVDAALKGGREIMEVYHSNELGVERKEDHSPVTLADKRANSVINEILLPNGIPNISEENKEIEFTQRETWNRCWIVDPLDGTEEFINRNDEFTVNIALVKNSIPILGVIYVPVTQMMYASIVPRKKLWKQKMIVQDRPISEQLPLSRPRKSTNQKVVILKS